MPVTKTTRRRKTTKTKETTVSNAPELYKVKVKDSVIVLKHKAIFAQGGYAIVTPDEHKQLVDMGVVADE